MLDPRIVRNPLTRSVRFALTTLGLAWLQERWPKPGTLHVYLTQGMSPRRIWTSGTPANFQLIGHSLIALMVGYVGGRFSRFQEAAGKRRVGESADGGVTTRGES